MKELIPKYIAGQVVRAEWEGKSVISTIEDVNIFTKLQFIGYKLDTDQFFREEELSTDIRIGDIVKSEFNGVVSLVTQTGEEDANVVHVECANNGSFRLLTSVEIEHLSEGEMQLMLDPLILALKCEQTNSELQRFVCKEKFADISYKIGEFVTAARNRFKGVGEIISTKKDIDDRELYLISANGLKSWCVEVDIKKWIPEVNDNVVANKVLFLYDAMEDSYNSHLYTTIAKVIEVHEKENSVILDDYTCVNISDLTPLSNYKGNE